RDASTRRAPSCPTRRSSDLADPGQARAGAVGAVNNGQGHAISGDTGPGHRAASAQVTGLTQALECRTRAATAGRWRKKQHPGVGDRKSTRLNSSHVKSSYAV